MLKKYYLIFRYMFIRSLQFRAEIVLYVFIDIIPFFVLFFLWKAIYTDQQLINNYSFSDIIQYYILVIFVQRFTNVYFESWRSQEIRMGKIDYFLTRPFSYINEVISKEVGGKIVSLLFSIPILIIFYFLTIKIFNISQIYFDLNNLFIFLTLLTTSYSIELMLALWIVLLTFWFEGSSGLEHFKWVILSIFSGSAIPFEFMPEWLQKIFAFLPFKYISYVPIQVIRGKMTFSNQDVVALFFVLFFMVLITKVLWSRALYKYSSAGG